MAATTTGLLLAGTGLQTFGVLSAGSAARRQGNFAARVNRQQAARERELSVQEERDFRKTQSAFFAERRAALGASGISASTGTSLTVAADFAAEVELNARRIREGGRVRATRLEQQASLNRLAGRNAQRRSRFRAGATVLGGLADADVFGSDRFPATIRV